MVVCKLRLLLCFVVLSFACDGWATPIGVDRRVQSPWAASETAKIHQEFLKRHRNKVVPLRAGGNYPTVQLNPLTLKKGPRVYGFLPYWEMDYEGFQWDVLTHVAYFCATIDEDGEFLDTHHWLTPSVAALIDEAHAHNVQVVLTIVNFENDEIGILCNDPQRRANAIQNILAMVQEAGGDGVNIDFEFVPYSAKAGFVSFMEELTEAFHEAIPGSHVSYAGPCVDWNGAYDYDALKLACDDVFIMGYCYHPHHDVPGPKAPIEGGDVWWSKHLTSTMEEYVTFGGDDVREKLIMGLPFYGYEWTVPSPGIPNTFSEDGDLILAREIDELTEDAPWVIEPFSMSSYQEFQTEQGEWKQRWLDNAESHGYKFDYLCDEEVGGVGFWALGYDNGESPIWDALRESLDTCSAWQFEVPEGPDVVDEDPDAVDEDTGLEADVEEGDDAVQGKDSVDSSSEEAEVDTHGEQSSEKPDTSNEDALEADMTSTDQGVGFQVSQGNGNRRGGSSSNEIEHSETGPNLQPQLLVKEEENGCVQGSSPSVFLLFMMFFAWLSSRKRRESAYKSSLLG